MKNNVNKIVLTGFRVIYVNCKYRRLPYARNKFTSILVRKGNTWWTYFTNVIKQDWFVYCLQLAFYCLLNSRGNILSYLVVSEDLPFIVIHKQYRDNRVKLSVNIGMPPFKNHWAGRTVLLAILVLARMEILSFSMV